MSKENVYIVTLQDGAILTVTTTKVVFDTHGVTFYYNGTLVAFVSYDKLVCFSVKNHE